MYFFFFNDTAPTEIYTRSIVGSVRCVQETGTWEMMVRREAAWVIVNCCVEGSTEQCHFLAENGVLIPLSFVLDIQDVTLLSACLTSIENILSCGDLGESENVLATQFEANGGKTKLEKLQHHENVEIYNAVVRLMDRFYKLQEMEGTQEEISMQTDQFPQLKKKKKKKKKKKQPLKPQHQKNNKKHKKHPQ
eukprot:TRINITY_DN61816_c0_g1_i1.p1 TRINITY_DN61816_c0_g1~~TRINITY_DN61816_c0_g1_i1.p1  ORF type:complete len:192 (-),score=45.04 TRINITY_DN61816_c0_g1_i1:61-636(-)